MTNERGGRTQADDDDKYAGMVPPERWRDLPPAERSRQMNLFDDMLRERGVTYESLAGLLNLCNQVHVDGLHKAGTQEAMSSLRNLAEKAGVKLDESTTRIFTEVQQEVERYFKHGGRRKTKYAHAVNVELYRESQLRTYVLATRLRVKLVWVLLRDLGVKPTVRSLNLMTRRMSPEDAEQFTALADKYGVRHFVNEYPVWILDYLRSRILANCDEMVDHITSAAEIYPLNLSEAYTRRNHMTAAVASAKKLFKILELAMNVLPVDVNKLIPYALEVTRLITMIKAWRKSDNRTLKRLDEAEPARIMAAWGALTDTKFVSHDDVAVEFLRRANARRDGRARSKSTASRA